MKGQWKGFLIGVIITLFLVASFGVSAEGFIQNIEVEFNKVNIALNGMIMGKAGENYTLANGQQVPYSILYKGTTYLPMRKVGELLGKEVGWDGSTSTAKLDDKGKTVNNNATIPTPTLVPSSTPAPYATESTSKAFRGFFQNTDYSNPDIFKTSGEQTRITDSIHKIADEFNDNQDISTMKEIFRWMNQNLKYGDGEKFARTSADIIDSRIYTGCTDMGLAFAALSRAKGIPTVFVQTGRIDWIEMLVKDDPGKGFITGHILLEVLLSDQKWYLVDSTAGKIYLKYDRNNFSLPDGFYVFSKSIEVWDSGIKDEQDNHEKMFSIFEGFDLNKYLNPKYDYIDLLSGTTLQSGDFRGNSLVIGTGAVILGEKEPVEAFYNKYLNGIDCDLYGELVVKESTLTTSSLLIDLHIRGSRYNTYLKDYLPDIDSNAKDGTIFRYTVGGQNRILIIGDSEESLVKIVNKLPNDFIQNK